MLSIFRYPGGKSKVRSRILKYAPPSYLEYREPFVGGGGIFFGTPPVQRWINDMHSGVVAVYTALRDRPDEFIDACRRIPYATKCAPGLGKGHRYQWLGPEIEKFFHQCVVSEEIDEALRYFVLQRCSFMGRVVYGDAKRTCCSCPDGWNVTKGDRLEQAAEALQNVKITQGDFEPVISAPGDDVWIYADPPYISDTLRSERSRLYEFSFEMEDHERLADAVKRCPHKVLLSYDNDPQGIVKSLYKDFNAIELEWLYSSATSGKRNKGRELLIGNYDLIEAAVHHRLNQRQPEMMQERYLRHTQRPSHSKHDENPHGPHRYRTRSRKTAHGRSGCN